MRLAAVTCLTLLSFIALSQEDKPLNVDSLKQALAASDDPVEQTKLMYHIGDEEMIFRISYWDTIIARADMYGLDEIKGQANNNIGFISDLVGDKDKAEVYFEEAIRIFKSINDSSGMSSGYYNLGAHFQDLGQYEKSMDLMHKSLEIERALDRPDEVARCYNGLAVGYDYMGLQLKSIEYYEKAADQFTRSGDNYQLATVLGNLAAVHYDQDDHETTEKYYLRSNELLEGAKGDHERVLLTNWNNLAMMYSAQGKKNKAKGIFEENLIRYQKIGDPQGEGISRSNLARIAADEGDAVRAESEFNQALELLEGGQYNYNLSNAKRSYARFLLQEGRLDESLEQAEGAHRLALQLSARELELIAIHVLAQVHEAMGQYKIAYDFQKQYNDLEDSVYNAETRVAAMGQKYHMEYMTKTLKDSMRAEEDRKLREEKEKREQAQIDAERENNKQRTMYLIIGLLLLASFGLFVFNRLRLTRRQRNTITKQKEQVDLAFSELEMKNREILDSIQYAKRLQDAILPARTLIDKWLPESFILYKPKDIIAGDFYWLEPIGDTIYLAAADCTGHGVPGAMVSVVCSNALTKALVEEGIREPAKILNRAREIVMDRFGKSEEEVRDGMDISLCAIDRSRGELQWAGANNPLWVIRKGDDELTEIKANKQPVGKYSRMDPFTNHTIPIGTGDTLFLFSDGFQDQFGGDRGKKYKATKFQKFLLELIGLDMPTHAARLDAEFEAWRGDLEQIDDVCVIGVRL